ncbi:MAG: serine hydrolase, partial [Dinghuibacter sp.]|nr:serine hydrolase [Dinghuibacter sp.]
MKKSVVQPAPVAPVADTAAPLPVKPAGKTDAWLADLLNKNPKLFGNITGNLAEYQPQIIYTRINRNRNNIPTFTDYHYNVSDQQYFYPASVVKMPLAFLALQKLNDLREKGFPVDMNTTMITGAARPAQTPVFNDPTTANGQPCIAQYIRKIFLVSDNDASNRLYEFLGGEYIHDQLHRMGFKSAEILHRLSVALGDEENRHTNPIQFYNTAGVLVYEQPAQYSNHKFAARTDKRGVGYISGGKLVNNPFDFSRKNRLSLEDMHGLLRSVMFPDQVPEKKRFRLTESDYRFLHTCMSQWPGESASPEYSEPEIWDTYVKFLLLGAEKKAPPKQIRIFSKSGQAYGYLTDVTYIADFENGIEFMLTATIFVNKDGIFNDDKYEYETIGLPFLKNLGAVIYEEE